MKHSHAVRVTLAAALLLGLTAWAAKPEMTMKKMCQMNPHQMKMPMAAPAPAKDQSLESLYSQEVPALSKAIDEAIRLLQAGDSKAALVQLQKAQKATNHVKTVLSAHIKPAFVNVRCPMMGSPIHPDKVTPQLTREFKGKKVAFCCGNCPKMWDQLTDAQKEQKLSQALPKDQK